MYLRVICLAFLMPVSFAQAQLSGNYTVGSGGDFPDLATAVANLNALGTNGEVKFNILPGVYDEQVTITNFTRTGNPDDLVIFLNESNLSDVTWTYKFAGAANNWVVNLDGADYVQFVNILFEAIEQTQTWGRLIQITGGATHITFDECGFEGFTGVNDDNTSLLYEADNSQNDHLTVTDSDFTGGYAAIDFDFGGGGTTSSDFQQYKRNQFDAQHRHAIISRGQETMVIDNTLETTSSTAAGYIAFNIRSGGSLIEGNELDMPYGGTGITLQNSGDTGAQDDLVINNMVSLFSPDGEAGMKIEKPGAKILHNTIRVATAATAYGLEIGLVSSTNPMMAFNNILVHEAGGAALFLNRFSDLEASDYNNLYSSTPGQTINFDNTPLDLGTWQNITSYETHSVGVPVTFQDVSGNGHNLRLAGTSDGDGKLSAVPQPDVPVDIDDAPRAATYPFAYMGAEEGSIELGVTFTVDVLLDGPYSSSTLNMVPDLNSGGILETEALTNPYTGDPFTCGKAVTVPPTFFDDHPDIVDWVCIELRTGNPNFPPQTIEDMQPAFVEIDGDVVSYTDGVSPPVFKVAWGNYYVVARHRSHLAAMSASARSATDGDGNFNFNFLPVFGTNPMRDVGDGNMTLWGGDGTGDGGVTAFDFLNSWLPINGGPPGYDAGDFDMNGSGTAFDFLTTWLPANGLATQVP